MNNTPFTRVDEGTTRDSGVALVEILVALTLLAVGFLSLVATLAQNARLQRVTQEKHLAVLGAESILEDMRRERYEDLATMYGSGGSRGPDFDLPGLSSRRDDVDGHVGRITLILDETATDSVAAAFELPRDLNGDGDATDINTRSSYRLLPVRILVEWDGVGGRADLEFHALLTQPEESE